MTSTTNQSLIFGSDYREVAVGDIVLLAGQEKLKLDSGAEIGPFPMAFRTYGTLNTAKDNVILVCHGLTGDQYMLEEHPVTDKPGWWELMAGPGKPLDTEKYFLICPNVLGGCMGSFGPKTPDAATGKPLGLAFPVLTIHDMVRAQRLLVRHLGIEKLFSVIGGSMGGMQVLSWAVQFPEDFRSAVCLAAAARHSAQNIAFHEIGRQAIMADPDWCEGRYFDEQRYPAKGLAVARMTAHVTYLSEAGLHRKFGRNLQDREQVSYGFDADFQIESYLRYQGKAFVERFDPNSYLYITRAMDYFDLEAEHGGNLSKAFGRVTSPFCVVSFSSDWLFPTEESRRIVHALNGAGAPVSFVEIPTDKGHDAFLLEEPALFDTVRGFLKGVEGV
ncbi:MAG: homoserine O-acetyltransferase [Hyphomicrobiales bacterium]|nr:homoserine O-acetyltransferase [Rickettsiales bacterium]MCP5361163.1 homoserine O-acetyltransferase [Hyphomicrobiales bacterium]